MEIDKIDTRAGVPALDHLLYVLSALGEMAEQMTTNPNPQTSIKMILRMAKGAFGIGKGVLFLYRPDEQVLELAHDDADERQPLVVSPEARRYFLSEGNTPILDLADPHPALLEFFLANEATVRRQPQSVWLPLTVNRHLVGLLMLGEKLSRERLSQTEVDILTLIGRQFSVAIHNFRLNTELKSANLQLGLKVRQLEQLNDINRSISSTLERSKIMREVVIRTCELLDARRGMLLTLTEDGSRLEAAAAFGFEWLDPLPGWDAAGAWASGALEGGLLLDAPALPEILRSTSCMVAPVSYQDRVFGVLAVFDKEDRASVGAFASEDLPLLTGLASQAATAIENARLYELATVDGLTQLYIRRHFEQRLAEELKRAQRYSARTSLMILDIDHFKKFNDTYGHQTGDEVLKLVAKTVKANVREELDVPGRFGGEELLVLMPETEPAGAWALAERVREAIASTPLPGPHGETLHVTVSVGVATYPLHGHDEESLLEAADKALYVSKARGRNRSTMCEVDSAH